MNQYSLKNKVITQTIVLETQVHNKAEFKILKFMQLKTFKHNKLRINYNFYLL